MQKWIFFILFTLCYSITIAQAPTSGLVAYYPFNGNANDESGNGNHLTVMNGAQLSIDRNGVSNKAYSFDGIDDYLTAPYSTSLNSVNNNDGFTFSAWVKTSGDYYIFCKAVGYDLHYRFLGNQDFIISECDNLYATFSTFIPQNEWVSLICVKRGELNFFYVNGKEVGWLTGSPDSWPVNNETPLEVGRDAHGPIEYMSGSLDEIRIYKRGLCDDEVLQLYQSEAPPNLVDLNNGLVAYYPFNGNANDESGNNNHLTVENGAIFASDRNEISNKAIYFDGSDDYLRAPYSTSLNSVNYINGYTFTAWVKSGGDYLILCKTTGNDLHYKFMGNISQIVAECDNFYGISSVSIPQNEWTSLVCVKRGNLIYFFKNGKEVASVTATPDSWPVNIETPLEIGRDAHGSVEYMAGKLDEIRIYNRPLSHQEVDSLYKLEAPGINLSSGLIAYYPFNGNANDESGNGNNGFVSGATLSTDRYGNPNQAYKFDGIDDYIEIPNSPSLENTSAISISAWVKVDSLTQGEFATILEKSNNSDYGHFAIGSQEGPSGTPYFFSYLNGQNHYTHFNGLGTSSWRNIIVLMDSSFANYYLNGQLLGAVMVSGLTTTSNLPLRLGTNTGGLTELLNGKLDDIRIYNRRLNISEVESLAGNPQNFSCVNWTSAPPFFDAESISAMDYLCSKSIIQSNQQANQINNTIRKDELAKILFRGLYEPDISAATPVDDAPNPFIDLQPVNSAYVKEAKALSYLEYDDGFSVFKREFTHFKPQYAILRKHVIKAMLETFNIKPYTPLNAPTPACWYDDVPQTDEMYYYILKARELGFIKQKTSFFPNNTITRKEAFLILYRILKYFETTSKPVPAITDFFIPSNINPLNYARSLGISDGNFNAYTKTSFAVAGLMPLTFAHSYNSAYTELPENGYNFIEPLGKGWTHNYNCFLQKVDDEDPITPGNKRTVITWGDGTVNSFTENAGIFTPETNGIYATLTADAGQNIFTYKTKSQVNYEFTRYILSTRSIWVLTSVKDRNNNALTLTWVTYPASNPTQIRLFKVEDAGGRYMQFAYFASEPSKIDSVKAVTGSIIRSVKFNYLNNFTDLKYYINPKGDTTHYYYENFDDPTKNHLLKQIKLPKGNIVDNTYEQRKLKSTQMAGQYQTNVNTQFNYTAANNTNFTESQIATTRNGITLSTTINQDQQGNVKNAISPTGNLGLAYDDPAHITKPTTFTNSINNLSAVTNYDAMGNVTNVTKSGAGYNLTESFTYNSFNDILSYTNARGYKTEFTYNANGNLTKIKDALNNETNIIVNSNGTVSKVTNPEGIYTDFMYDAFGNTTQSKLMNAITASALYDDASRLTSKTDPNGTVTNIEYDINDLVKKVIVDPTGLNNTVAYHYDKNDNLDTIVNPKGGKTSLKYNNFDQMVEYRFGNFSKTYAYNEDGTLNTFTDQNGNSFNYVYNSDGTLQGDGYASYGYDAEFNLQTIYSNYTGKTITFGYDALKRTNSISYNDYGGNTVQYEYDNNNNVTAITYPGGFKVGYQYDALDRLVRVYNFTTNSNFAVYTYYNDGRLKDQVNGNGTKTVYRYDTYGRIDSIGNYTSTNANIASYKFTMDNLGNHLSETNYEPALPVMASLQTEGFTYVHDDMNRMNSRGNTSFTYDNNGNNTAATGEWNSNLTFDVKDNLLTSTSPALSCEYDALENRRRKNDTLYVLDILGGSNVLMETDASGNPYSYYIHGLGLICRLDAAQTNPAYYHYDYRGSTTAITNSSETTTHSYRYGAFGEMLLAVETGFKNLYRYVGKYGVQYEGDSLYFMRARYYNALKGRFLGEDPVWGTNLYGYGGNNPINVLDPSGRFSVINKKDGTLKVKTSIWEDIFGVAEDLKEDYDNINRAVDIFNDINTLLNSKNTTSEDKIILLQNFLKTADKYVGKYVTPKMLEILANNKVLNGVRLAAAYNDAIQKFEETGDIEAAINYLWSRARELGIQ